MNLKGCCDLLFPRLLLHSLVLHCKPRLPQQTSFSSVTSVTRSVLPLKAGGARKSGSQTGSAQTARWRHAQ